MSPEKRDSTLPLWVAREKRHGQGLHVVEEPLADVDDHVGEDLGVEIIADQADHRPEHGRRAEVDEHPLDHIEVLADQALIHQVLRQQRKAEVEDRLEQQQREKPVELGVMRPGIGPQEVEDLPQIARVDLLGFVFVFQIVGFFQFGWAGIRRILIIGE